MDKYNKTVSAIHNSPFKIVLVSSGGGTNAISELLKSILSQDLVTKSFHFELTGSQKLHVLFGIISRFFSITRIDLLSKKLSEIILSSVIKAERPPPQKIISYFLSNFKILFCLR